MPDPNETNEEISQEELKGVSGGVRSPGKSEGTVKTEDKLDLLGDKSRQIKPKENLDEYEFISS